METIEAGNKKIKMFMGHVNKYNYHNDWNHLMPVVDKIENLGYKFQICRRRADILQDEVYPIPIIEKIKEETKLKSVWLAAVEFIKFFNSQNKKEV